MVTRAVFMLSIHAVLLVPQLTSAAGHYTARLSRTGYVIGPEVKDLVFSPDSSQLLVGADGGTFLVQPRGAEILEHIRFSPFSMNYSKDGSRAFLIGRYGRRLLDMKLGSEVSHESAGTPGYVGLSFARRNGKLVIAGIDPGSPAAKGRKIRIGDELIAVGSGKTGRMQRVIRRTPQEAACWTKGPAGTFVRLTVVAYGQIEEQTYVLQRLARKQDAGRNVYLPFAGVESQDHVVWSLTGGNLVFCSARTGQAVSTLQMTNLANNAGTPAVSPDSKQFALLGRYIDPPKRTKVSKLDAGEARTPDNGGNIAAGVVKSTASEAGWSRKRKSKFGVEIYDIATRKMTATFPVASEGVRSIVPVRAFYGMRFSHDGSQLIVGTWSALNVYDIAGGKKIGQITPPKRKDYRTVETFAVSDRLAAVGGVEGEVWLMDLKSGLLQQEIKNRETDAIEQMEFSPDGNWLAYAVDGVLHVVDVTETGLGR